MFLNLEMSSLITHAFLNFYENDQIKLSNIPKIKKMKENIVHTARLSVATPEMTNMR